MDPFFGSGTTALSCSKHNRKCIGFEIHQEYIDLFVTRLKKIVSITPASKIELDISQYNDLSKEAAIKKLSKNPKKMLFDILKNIDTTIKNTIPKTEIANTLYELLIKKEEV